MIWYDFPFMDDDQQPCLSSQKIFDEKKKRYDDNLLIRRKRLASLLNDEMESWKMEVLGKVETLEDRKAR